MNILGHSQAVRHRTLTPSFPQFESGCPNHQFPIIVDLHIKGCRLTYQKSEQGSLV